MRYLLMILPLLPLVLHLMRYHLMRYHLMRYLLTILIFHKLLILTVLPSAHLNMMAILLQILACHSMKADLHITHPGLRHH
jgi:hypothetical protein